MPRLRGGDVHAYNLFVDSSNARIVKEMRDDIVAANPTLASALSSTYSFGITSQASISTEGGAVQVEDSVFWGVLTPFRNNQTDVNNPAFTGAIQGSNILHILLATDTQFMPATSQQSTFSDRGFVWASWQGNSDDPLSSLGPTQAPQIPFVWHNGRADVSVCEGSRGHARHAAHRAAGRGRRQDRPDDVAMAERGQLTC